MAIFNSKLLVYQAGYLSIWTDQPQLVMADVIIKST